MIISLIEAAPVQSGAENPGLVTLALMVVVC
jgi:hypothetical protein